MFFQAKYHWAGHVFTSIFGPLLKGRRGQWEEEGKEWAAGADEFARKERKLVNLFVSNCDDWNDKKRVLRLYERSFASNKNGLVYFH